MKPIRDARGNGPFYRFAGWRLYIRRPGCTECLHHYWWGGCWRNRHDIGAQPVCPNFRDSGHGEYFNDRWPDAHGLLGCETICDGFLWETRAKQIPQHGCAVERRPERELTLRVDEIPAVVAALSGYIGVPQPEGEKR